MFSVLLFSNVTDEKTKAERYSVVVKFNWNND